jgi:hypothetical protein
VPRSTTRSTGGASSSGGVVTSGVGGPDVAGPGPTGGGMAGVVGPRSGVRQNVFSQPAAVTTSPSIRQVRAQRALTVLEFP